MTDDPSSRNARVNVTIKVSLKYPDRDTFVERFSQNISRAGIFVRDPKPLPMGSRVAFDYRLSDNSQVMRGKGLVRWVRTPEEASEPDSPPGMGIEFVDLDPATEMLVDEIVGRFGDGARAPRRQTGKLPISIAASADETPPAAQPRVLPPAASKAPPPPAVAKAPPPAAVTASVAPSAAPSAALTADDLARSVAFEGLDEDDSYSVGQEDADAVAAVLADRSALRHAERLRDTLVLDLSGSEVWLLGHDQPTTLTPRLRTESGTLYVDGLGTWMPGLPSLLGQGWPSAAANALARRAGFKIAKDAGAGLAVVCDRSTLSLETVIAKVLTHGLRKYTAAPAWQQVVAVVPSGLSGRGETLLRALLSNAGLGTVHIMPSSMAAFKATDITLQSGQLALVVHLGGLQSEVAVLDHDGQQRRVLTVADLSFWEVDETLAERTAQRLLSRRQIDIATVPEEQLALRKSVKAARLSNSMPWAVVAADTPLELTPADVAKWLMPLNERLVLSCELARQSAGGPGSAGTAAGAGSSVAFTALIVTADEPPWPGALAALQAQLGCVPVLLPDGAWGRMAGARRSLSLTGASPLPNHEA